MVKAGPFQLVVHKRMLPPMYVFHSKADLSIPEVELSLKTEKGIDVLDKLCQNYILNKYFNQVGNENYSNTKTVALELPQPFFDLKPVPPPIHIKNEFP